MPRHAQDGRGRRSVYAPRWRTESHAEAVFGFVDHAEQDVESMTELYADHGYDAIMKALEEREEEDERWLN